MNELFADYVYIPPEKEITEWYPIKGFKNGLKKHGNQYLTNAMNSVSVIRNMKLRSDDVFVVGAQKSGTTWIEDICWLIQHDLNFQEFKEVNHVFRVPYIDLGFKHEILDQRTSPRLFKSHLTLDLLPENVDKISKVVYCVRNPKDVVVSAYNFFKKLTIDQFDGTFEEYCDAFLEGTICYGPWWYHIDNFINNPNIHVIFYEDLLTNTLEKIKELATFIGKTYSDDDIKKLAAFTSFDNLKKTPGTMEEMMKEISFANEDLNFYRKGQIGSWYSSFTPELSKRFDEVINNKLKYKGKFNYGTAPEGWEQNS